MPEIVAKEPIAIIGVGCVLPDAPDVPTFWNNLLEGKNSITEVDPTRWDPALYWDADRTAEDRTYAKIGGFVHEDSFNPMLYRMPPKVVAHVDASQRWALAATRQALLDAGLATGLRGDEGKSFDRDRTAVIVGNAMGGETNKTFAKRLFWPEARNALLLDAEFQALPQDQQTRILERAEATYKQGVPAISEDTMPGHLSNVVAGRIANAFDFGGKNFTTDAACASSLAALDSAMDTLRNGQADMVIWGGTDRSMDITGYIEFSKIGALSPDGSRPFDKNANGFVMGEGCAMFLLKRLSDAERDGDKIYAVVRGIGGSSDGKGKGITAPNPIGQVKAVQRAYTDAQVDPNTIGYLEAHGTSTPVGDPVELQSVQEAFTALNPNTPPAGSIAVGSVKSNIGHLKAAAGAAGMLKATLALHEGRLPPSINVTELNPRIDWSASPFRVQTDNAQWDQPAKTPRRAAVSSFGFGGTNFHVVMEQYVPGQLQYVPQYAADPNAPQPASASAATMTSATTATTGAGKGTVFDASGFANHMETAAGLEAEPLVLDAANAKSLAGELSQPISFPANGAPPRIRDKFHAVTQAGMQGQQRVGIAVADPTELPKKLELAQKAATNPAAARLAFNQGVFLGQGTPKGKVAFLFPGQGTQYVNMFRDLAAKYEVVRNTFHEADEVLFEDLGGIKLTDILWPQPDTPEARKAAEEKLKLTEFTQPAVLAADVAILRLLKMWGVKADVVAGHSLGEYGALVAAGVLTFADALHAVAARGREMATVNVPDLGKMAAVPADWETVQAAIASVEGYVIAANKNCPSQTVLAGSSPGVDAAVEQLQANGLQAQYLPVSAAFHSEIVAPASQPLRRVLGRLNVQAPTTRCLSNVGAKPYGDDPEEIRDNLAVQVANPVEWIDIVERMYNEGVRTFIEVGPKRALTGFALDILKGKDDVIAICANHPKKGGVQHINELFAFLGAWGFQPKLAALDDPTMYTETFRDPKAAFVRTSPAMPAIDDVQTRLRALEDAVMRMAGGNVAPPSTSATVTLTTPASPAATAPGSPAANPEETALLARLKAFGLCLDDVAISGASVGLPGTNKPLFAEDNFDRILRGDNLIDTLPEPERIKLADKNIVRLQKGTDGSANFQAVTDIAQVIQLAGRRGEFDLEEWGIDAGLVKSLDRTFQYAIAAGLEALHDAGIPLVRTYLKTSTGSYLPKDWKLPESLRDETGIIFASAFPGYDKLLRDVSKYLAERYAGRTLDELQNLYEEIIGIIEDENLRDRMQGWFDTEFARLQDVLPGHGAERYEFNRKFLFEVLSMGHAQLAQLIGARGPNTQVNAACASTTQAVAIAEDWIRTGRARRVLVVGADDVTSDAMFEWIGSGFLASGAATTKSDVTQAALPFDARRHGMIVGMGAVGLVVEATPETEARGMAPIATLLASTVANSAYHGSRLDVEHISTCMQELVAKASRRYGIDAATIADKTVFVSHETYTPARGGSASAEIHALRATFGDKANRVVIANTKGFTGHPQGAGVEDAIALKMLQRGIVPPIANFRDPDPELGDLRLSQGGPVDVQFALRLAAGFGSQVAMTLTQLVAREDARVTNAQQYDAWLAQVSGQPGAKTEVENRTLRIIDAGAPARETATVVAQPQAPVPITSAPEPTPTATPTEDVLTKLTNMVAEQTGYPLEMLEPDLDMEADLGIDTVKQAELFGAIRDHYALPLEEGLQIKDYPTLRKVAGYFQEKIGGAPATTGTPAAAAASTSAAAPATQVTTAPAAAPSATTPAATTPSETGGENVLTKLTNMVAEQTGYPIEMLEPDLDMEADLGIDTVKQAELFGAIRDHYSLPLEEGLQIKDYPTLRKVAGYFQEKIGGAPATASSPAPATSAPTPAAPAPAVPATPAPGTAPATAAPTTGTTPPAGGEEVLSTLTAMVAEQTGYPIDMLEPDLDMEADLGIDTVKQAELFGAIREHYNLPLEDGLQIKDYPTIRKVAEYFGGKMGNAAPAGASAAQEPAAKHATAPAAAPVSTAATAPATTAAATAPANDEVLATLTGMVAEQTGYPIDMLEPDLDMEADLGIDTVKQAELFGAIRDHYSLPLEDGLQIKDYPTIRKVAEYFSSRVGGPAAPEPAPTPAPVAPAAAVVEAPKTIDASANPNDPANAPIRRLIPVARPEAQPDADNGIAKGPMLVVGDNDQAFVDAWKSHGFTATTKLPEGQPPAGILFLATKPGATPEDRAGTIFDIAKQYREEMADGFVAVVTRQDGAHGTVDVRDATMAAAAGIGKALRKELGCTVKVIDTHPEDAGAPARVVEEVLTGGQRTEVAYDAHGTRYVIDVAPQDLETAMPDVSGMGLVVSGGAQGITVEMLLALAPQNPKLLLLGRTKQPAESEEWAYLDEAGWKAKEAEAMAQLKAAGEKVTPMSLKRAVDPMRKAAEVYRNLIRLQDAGADVLYAPVDVTDAKIVGQAVAWARDQWGQIDGVIHAAGVEISKDLASKDRAQFDMVLGIKTQGWKALMEATKDDDLQVLASFGSVAGRFGNIGQTDYSAANDYLCKAVRQEAIARGAKVGFTIAWGPWGEVGMATRGSIMQIMEASGVTPIPTAEGVGRFLAEMATPGHRESVVAGALGAIDVDGQIVDTLYDPAIDEVRRVIAEHKEHFRLVESVEAFVPAQRITTTVLLDQHRDAAMKDHRVDGVPYLAGVFGLEAFAEAAGLLVAADHALQGAEDVRFALPLKQLKDAPQIGTIHAEVVSAEEEPFVAIHCKLTSQFHAPDGKPLGEPKLHFEATLRFGAVPKQQKKDVPMLAPMLGRADIYPPFFHGPCFQVLERAGPLGSPSVALWRNPDEQMFGDGDVVWLSHPMVTEALFQTCGLGVLESEQAMCLPAGIAKLDVLVPGDVPQELRLLAKATGRNDAGNRTFDAWAIAKDGTVVLALHEFAMIETGPAPARVNALTDASHPESEPAADEAANLEDHSVPTTATTDDTADAATPNATDGDAKTDGDGDSGDNDDADDADDGAPGAGDAAETLADNDATASDADAARASDAPNLDAQEPHTSDPDGESTPESSPTGNGTSQDGDNGTAANGHDEPTNDSLVALSEKESDTASPGAESPKLQAAETEGNPVAVANADLPRADVELPAEDDVHFSAVPIVDVPAEPEWFSTTELDKWASFPAPKRAADWRAGRLAVKIAVVETHDDVEPRDVEILADEATGKPSLLIDGEPSPLFVSITHRDGIALAALSIAPLGIDLETVEDRAQSFLEESFSVDELKGLLDSSDPSFDATCMWAAKEAAFKRAGVGLNAELRAHQVISDGVGGARVEGPMGSFGIKFFDLAGRVLALSAEVLEPEAEVTP